MPRSFFRRGSVLLSWALLWSISPARAATLSEPFKAYGDKNHLLVRPVRLPNGGTRLFAPVTAASFSDFRQLTNPGLVLNHWQDEHLSMIVSPHQDMAYGSGNGRLVSPHQFGLSGVEKYIVLGATADQQAFFVQKALNEPYDKEPLPGVGAGANCMSWLLKGQVAPNVWLPNAFGVRRSKSAVNLGQLLIYDGDEKVAVGIPIHVGSLEPLAEKLRRTQTKMEEIERTISGLRASNAAPSISQLQTAIREKETWLGRLGATAAYPAVRTQADQVKRELTTIKESLVRAERGGVLSNPNAEQIAEQERLLLPLRSKAAALRAYLAEASDSSEANRALKDISDSWLLGAEPAGKANHK